MKTVVVLVSADAEWRAVRRRFQDQPPHSGSFGGYFTIHLGDWSCTFLQTGWGKIAAAAATQYAIDNYHPDLLINLGTCGGFAGQIELGEIVLADRTIVYDIYEKMGDADAHIAHYSTEIDLSWLDEPYPARVRRTLLVSGDRDLAAEEIPQLMGQYQAVAGDWESGAIAWVAKRNNAPLLILRAVSDLVDESGSPAYGDSGYYSTTAAQLMDDLIRDLPAWLWAASSKIPGR